jgi:hypothetical protein
MAFGNLGVSVGTVYPKRAAVRAAGLHRHLMRGIAGRPDEGADAIVMSGGYDDIDRGDEIVYTGEGGLDENGKNVGDQELTRGNAALVTSQLEGLPVRVIRGSELQSAFAPSTGYQYDGLFYVEDHWHERPPEHGFLRYRYRLVRASDDAETLVPPPPPPPDALPRVRAPSNGLSGARKSRRPSRLYTTAGAKYVARGLSWVAEDRMPKRPTSVHSAYRTMGRTIQPTCSASAPTTTFDSTTARSTSRIVESSWTPPTGSRSATCERIPTITWATSTSPTTAPIGLGTQAPTRRAVCELAVPNEPTHTGAGRSDPPFLRTAQAYPKQRATRSQRRAVTERHR